MGMAVDMDKVQPDCVTSRTVLDLVVQVNFRSNPSYYASLFDYDQV